MVWSQKTELCKTSPETWHLHLVISRRVRDRNRHGSALYVFSRHSPNKLCSRAYDCLQSRCTNVLKLEFQQLKLFKITVLLLSGHRGEVRRPALWFRLCHQLCCLGQSPSLTSHFSQEQDVGQGVEEVLSGQQRPVAPCGSGGHADLGLVLDTSLPEELSVCLERFMFPSGVVSWVLGFRLDLDLGAVRPFSFLRNKTKCSRCRIEKNESIRSPIVVMLFWLLKGSFETYGLIYKRESGGRNSF